MYLSLSWSDCSHYLIGACISVRPWTLAATRAVKTRRCSRGRLQPARLLHRVRRPSAARQRTTRRTTEMTTGPCPSALPPSNCWQNLARALAHRRYANTTHTFYMEPHLHCNHDMSSMLMERKNWYHFGTSPLDIKGKKTIRWDSLIRQAYIIIFKDLRDVSSWFGVLMPAAWPLGLKSFLQSNLNMSPQWHLSLPCPQSPLEENSSLFCLHQWDD